MTRRRLKTTRNVEFIRLQRRKVSKIEEPRMHMGEKSMEEVHLVKQIQEHQTRTT